MTLFSLPSLPRVLCETVKDFVARVGKAYEKATESSEESEVMARKVKLEKLFGFLLLKWKNCSVFRELGQQQFSKH